MGLKTIERPPRSAYDLAGKVGKQFYPPLAGSVLYLPGYPPMGATIVDQSGNNNHGTLNLPTWTRLPSGLWALDFITDDYVDCGDINALDGASKVTMKIWFRIDGSTTVQRGLFIKSADGTGTNQIGLMLSAFNYLYAVDGNGSNSGVYKYEAQDANFHQAILVFDGTLVGNARLALYRDGVVYGDTWYGTHAATTSSNALPLYMGAEYFAGAIKNFFDGLLALGEVLVGVAWSAEQAASSFQRERYLLGV